MIIFTVQDTKVKYLNNLCTQQNSQKEVYSVHRDEVFQQSSKWLGNNGTGRVYKSTKGVPENGPIN